MRSPKAIAFRMIQTKSVLKKPKNALVTSLVRLVNDKAYSLTLTNIVETHNTDVAVRILTTALTYFVEHFLSVSCAKQRKLPKRPVVESGGRIFFKLNTRDKALVNHELNLASDLLVTEGREVRKSFVTLFFR
ncbi:hypothetical protein AWQ21_09460 [Picosynechococcus sp. PCC 7003]|nr:hypothetical protein AWQ21_09460 [Picosynechococcus sp. PCC 7003]